MVLAFKAYPRICEMVFGTSTEALNTRMFAYRRRRPGGCWWDDHYFIQTFKHIAKQGPQIVHVRGEKIGEISIHPAALMREYLQTRGRVEATLSAYMDGTSMSREEFDFALKQLLSFAGLSNQVFKCHSVTSAVTLWRFPQIYPPGLMRPSQYNSYTLWW